MTVASNKSLAIHNVGFYKPKVRAINGMRYCCISSQLAISRADNSIEIWDVKYLPYLHMIIPHEVNCSVEDLEWCGTRLFSCGFQGAVVEYNLFNGSVKNSTSVTGGVAWCMEYCSKGNLLAVGTEDGFINTLEVSENGLEHLKMLDKQQGRVLCICWDSTGELLVTGSIDVVRVWNFKTGHAVHKMMTGRSHNNRETIVWSLSVTTDLTIISGDSRGFLTFWDGKLGTQMDSIRSHEADILSLQLTNDESSVVCAGVDPVLAVFSRVQGCAGRRQWARGGLYRVLDHDVRAVATTPDGRIFSAGVSGFLAVVNGNPKLRFSCPPFLKGNCLQVVPKLKQLLLRYLNHVEIWLLGSAMADSGNTEAPLLISTKPKCLLRLDARANEVVMSAAISARGNYIAMSTNKTLAFYYFRLEDLAVTKVGDAECGPSSLASFYTDGQLERCVVVTSDNAVYDFQVTDDAIEETYNFRPSLSSSVTECIIHLTISPCGTLACMADAASNVAVWSISSWTVVTTLPNYRAVPTAVAFAADSSSVIVTYSDLNIVEFDLKKNKYTNLSQELGNSGTFQSALSGIIVNPRRNDSVILYDDSTLCAVYEQNLVDNDEKLVSKVPKKSTTQKKLQKSSIVVRKFKHIAGAAWLDDDEMVLVEASPLSLSESLPPLFMKKKFGT